VASALKRYKQAGVIRQLARGIYDYLRVDPELGLLHPSMDEIAKVVAGRGAIRLQASGAYAANLLGLSTQMPMGKHCSLPTPASFPTTRPIYGRW